jgi:ABC-type arginine transport system permease subunit
LQLHQLNKNEFLKKVSLMEYQETTTRSYIKHKSAGSNFNFAFQVNVVYVCIESISFLEITFIFRSNRGIKKLIAFFFE